MRLDATAWLTHLDDARTLALAGDVEGVHQVRVALRRLRVWLGFKGHDSLQEELRWACGELALLRDLDVFGEVLTSEALEELRPGAVEAAAEALGSERWLALRQRLTAVRSPKRARAKRTLPKLEKKLEQLRRALPPGDGEALHRLRRQLRRVRYAREWLGLGTSDLGAEQERLGALCDLLALSNFATRLGVEVPSPLEEGIARAFELLEAHQ
ncbi:MAG: CHAD domain-containing protein [Archangium sp.]|nr:CHAD domain-containing protein [Archangium sp.]